MASTTAYHDGHSSNFHIFPLLDDITSDMESDINTILWYVYNMSAEYDKLEVLASFGYN